ncbi:hypothetical protein D3C75_980490 [compost metagenome]
MERIPPKITMALSTTNTMPTYMGSMLKATELARAMELACTALNTRPKAISRKMENITPIQRMPNPFSI